MRLRLVVLAGVLSLGTLAAVTLLGKESRPAPVASGQNAKVARPVPRPTRASPAAAPLASVAPAPERPVVVAAGGDVNFGREAGQAILADPKYDPFAKLGSVFADADVRFVNLESQLSDQKGETQSPYNRLIFTGPPGGAETLAQAGIQVASTANNHAWDYGRSALFETLDNLKRAGVKAVGTGRTLDAAYAPAKLEVRGVKIAIFAVTHIWNDPPFASHEGSRHVAWAAPKRLIPLLEHARRTNDIVLLAYHGGAEYQDAPAPPTRRFFKHVMRKKLVDAIIGHHPHVPQGVGWYDGRPAFYSLGNFVFAGHDWAPRTKLGYIARLSFRKGEPVRAEACPFALDGHVPRPILPGDPRSADARAHLTNISQSTGGSDVAAPDVRGCFALAPPSVAAPAAIAKVP
jgi:poly-gamma-glutamate capsule biosynthesis protein CapA/YwtB (metallophosphatase superfamily)